MPTIKIYDANLSDYLEEHPSFDWEGILKFFIKTLQEQQITPNDIILDSIDRRLDRILKDLTITSQEQFSRFTLENKDKPVNIDLSPILSYFGVFMENLNSLRDTVSSLPAENNTFILEKFVSVSESLDSLCSTILEKPAENSNLAMEKFAAIVSDNISHMRDNLTRLDDNVKGVHEKIEIIKDTNSKQKENSTLKGNTSEKEYLPLLRKRLDRYEVSPTTSYHCMDFEIKDHTGLVVGIELKNYKYTVPKDQVDKFHADMKTQDISGILVSIDTNIVGCSSFDIKVIDDNIAVYISKNGYNMDLIEKAYQFICNWKQSQENQEKKGFSFTQDEITRVTNTIHSQAERMDSAIVNLETSIDDLKRIRKMDIIGLLTGINISAFSVIKISRSKWKCSVCETIFSSKTKCQNHICKNL